MLSIGGQGAGEVENECTSHNSIVLAICMPKISKFSGDMTKFWQKQVGSFISPTLYNAVHTARMSVF